MQSTFRMNSIFNLVGQVKCLKEIKLNLSSNLKNLSRGLNLSGGSKMVGTT